MISHTTIGTNDYTKAESFYDELLPCFGGEKIFTSDRAVFWGFGENSSKLAISKPFNGEPASFGNGTMVAFTVDTVEKVEFLYNKAISLGGTSEGEPGERYDGLYYGAYFRDLDGNKFSIYHLLATTGKD